MRAAEASGEVYEFGPFHLDVQEATLLRDGARVAIQPLALDGLVLLLRRAGSLVSHEELRAALWPDVHVGARSLTQLVHRIRLALGDRAEDGWIEAVGRRGYRFRAVAPPPEADPDPDLLGRAALVEELRRIRRSGAFLVTLHGPGGVGKTRLAKEVFGDALWVSVAGCDGEGALLERIARAAGLQLEETPDALRGVGTALAGRTVVLDEAEGCAAALGELLERLGRARVGWVVTSRVLLGARDEHVLAVDPLPPDAAKALWRRLAPRGAAEEGLEELLARLGHVPLAIELAASRAAVLPPPVLVRRLGERGLDELARRGTDRHASVRAVAEDSWRLLSEPTRRFLAVLATLPDGLGTDELEEAVGPDAVDALDELRRHAWIRGSPVAWSLPDPLRAAVAPAADPEGPRRRLRMRLLAEVYDGRPPSHERLAWALEDASRAADHEEAVSFAAALLPDARLAAPREVTDRLLALGLDAVDRATRAVPDDVCQVLTCGAKVASGRGDLERAVRFGRRALALRGLSPAHAAEARQSTVFALGAQGRSDEARALAAEGLAAARASGDPRALATALGTAARLATNVGAPEAAALVAEGLQVCGSAEAWTRISLLHTRALVARREERFADALLDLETALALVPRDRVGLELSLELLVGNLEDAAGHAERAAARWSAVAERADRLGMTVLAYRARGNHAHAQLRRGDLEAAARSLPASHVEAEALGVPEAISVASVNLGVLRWLQGQLEVACACFARAADASREPNLRESAAAYLAGCRVARGDLDGAASLLEPEPTTLAGRRLWALARADLAAAHGDLERARDLLASAPRGRGAAPLGTLAAAVTGMVIDW